MSSHCAHDQPPRAKRAMVHPGDRSPLEQYGGFIEPRQLSLAAKDARHHTAMSRDSFMTRSPIESHHDRDLDHMGRPYAQMDHARYSPPHRFMGHHHPPEFTVHGSRGDEFLWSGDYGPPGTIPGGPDDYHPHQLPFDDWAVRDPRYAMPYDPPPFFGQHLPSINELIGHHGPLPPMHVPQDRGMPHMPPHFGPGPMSPFPYDGPPPELFNHPPPPMHEHLENPAQMPLLPFINESEFMNERNERKNAALPPPPPDETEPENQGPNTPPQKKARTSVTQRNAKPLQVEELLHDHSRFAKVVKAFLSIEAPDARTVPEISKRVSEMYAGQYSDFEAVKRMVNDVLQKHKAFWHPGRGSPYQLNLGEGRARREFPSSKTRGRGGGRGGDDDDYYGGGRTTRSKKSRRLAMHEESFPSQSPSRQASLEADPDYIPSGGAYHDSEAFVPEQPYGHLPPIHELAPGQMPVFDEHHSGGPILTGSHLAMILNPPPQDGPHGREPLPIDPALLFATQPPPHEPLPIDPQLMMSPPPRSAQRQGMVIKLESADQDVPGFSMPHRRDYEREDRNEFVLAPIREASSPRSFAPEAPSEAVEPQAEPETHVQQNDPVGEPSTSTVPEPTFAPSALENAEEPRPEVDMALQTDIGDAVALGKLELDSALSARPATPSGLEHNASSSSSRQSPVEPALPSDDSPSPLAGTEVTSDDEAANTMGASDSPSHVTASHSDSISTNVDSKDLAVTSTSAQSYDDDVPMDLDSGDEDDEPSPRQTSALSVSELMV